jgi:hypothetical protein
MESGQFRDKISHGRTFFDGRMLAYMEANAWEETLQFHSKMKEAASLGAHFASKAFCWLRTD